jgi:DNA-binding IscR family transcriptional regulator
MALLEPWLIRPQPDHECDWNDNQQKIMKQDSVSGTRLLVYLGLTALVLGIGYRWARSPRSSPAASASALPSPAEPSAAAREDAEPREVPLSQFVSVSQPPAVMPSTGRAVSAAQPAVARVEASPQTRQLVASLTNLDLSHGQITREQAQQWKEGLQALTQQGVTAVPAIREFLEQNQDLNFAAVKGGGQLGQSSVRAALIDVLQQIGGPESTALMLQTLQTTALPSEIALLARNLEQQAPGQYRQETLNAVNDVLAMAEKGQLAGWDVGALFQVLQSYGDATTATALAQLQSKWNYYATMALAGLPGGEGVQSLIRQAQDGAAGASRSALAFQLLAQMAAEYPDAGAALIEQARRNQISDATWRKIAAGLAGDQYQIGMPPELNALNSPLPGLKTYHIEAGNQNFYSLPLNPNLPNDQLSQRLALIDQLLASASTPAAVEALQNARALLGKRPNN